MLSGKILRDAIISGANNIINNKESVDELNVFPVPDGDTGTNMSMTIRNAVAELNMLSDSATVETVAQTAASAMQEVTPALSFPCYSEAFQKVLQESTRLLSKTTAMHLN